MNPPNPSELHAKTQRSRLDFIQTDLALCSTFATLAVTELETMGDREAALLVHAKAEEAHTTVVRFLLDVDDGPQKQEIQRKLTELRTKLDNFHDRLHT